MATVLCQRESLLPQVIAPGAPVAFEQTVLESGNVFYDSATNEIRINAVGNYKIFWWVAVQSVQPVTEISFSLVSNFGDSIQGDSTVHENQVCGFAAISAPFFTVRLRLLNSGSTTYYTGNTVPVTCSIMICMDDVVIGDEIALQTYSLGNTNTGMTPDEGSGNDQAVAGIMYSDDVNVKRIDKLTCYVTQLGAGTGTFQMALLGAVNNTTATVLAITAVTNTITAGLFVRALSVPIQITGETIYYTATYNQVNNSELAATTAGFGSVNDAFPINFRVQNLTGFTVGDTLSMSDVSLGKTPWMTATTI